jgi:hypothetical protein
MCGERSLSEVSNGRSDRQYVLSTYCGVTARETCSLHSHPDFNHSGAFSGSAMERTHEAYLNTTDYRHRIKRIQLMNHLRADGTRIVRNDTANTTHPPIPPRGHDFTSRRDRDDGGESGRGGTGRGRRNNRRVACMVTYKQLVKECIVVNRVTRNVYSAYDRTW